MNQYANIVRSSSKQQAGFSVLSALLALVIGSIISAGVIEGRQTEAQIRSGRIQGDLINLVKNGANIYAMENYPALQSNLPVTKNGITLAPGTAVGQSMSPRVQDLVAMGYLSPGTSDQATAADGGIYQVRFRSEPVGCVAAACNIPGELYVDRPIRRPGTAEMNGVVVGAVIDKVGGDVVVSLNTNPAQLTALSGASVPNPVAGSPVGIVGARVGFGASGFGRFLVLGDPRDPNFQGSLSAAGTVTFAGTATIAGPTTINNNMTVTGSLNAGTTSVGGCARILATTGRAGFGCANPDDLPAGYVGGVRTPDLVANGRIVATDNPAAFNGSNGNYAFVGLSGGVAEVRTSGRAAGDRLTPLGQYAAGSICAPADEGSIARNLGVTGLVVCQTGAWRAMATLAVAGSACAPNGTMATAADGVQLLCVNGAFVGMDTIVRGGTPGQLCTVAGATAIDTANGNETLLCRANPGGGPLRYMRLRDITTNLMFIASYEVTDASLGASGIVVKPICTPAAGQSFLPILQLIPKIFSSPDGGVAVYGVDTGASWSVFLRNGAGNVLAGNPTATAVAQVFCYFP